MRFTKHYSLAEAREMLPQLRVWLDRLAELRRELARLDERLGGLLVSGSDLGGPMVNKWARMLAEIQSLVLEFVRRQIQLKDMDRGLVDFPAILDGKEVFFCWEQGEEDIEFWHDLDSGYAGRERLK